MKIIELKQPRPRARPSATQRHSFSFTGFLPLPKVGRIQGPPLGRLLASRASRRGFLTPISYEQLSTLVWHSARLREKQSGENATLWERRIAPSGGGCHPIHLVVMGVPTFPSDILIYDAEHNGFGVVRSTSVGLLKKIREETEKCLRIRKGTVLWFLADAAKTGSKYHHPESLIWRDSGALLAIIGLVAEGLGLEFCALGIHETPSLRRALFLPASVLGVGGCVVAGGPIKSAP